MSHFCLFVLLEEEPDLDHIAEEIAGPLAPFSEEIQVKEYEEECWCVGRKARREAAEQAAEEMDPIPLIREIFWKEMKDKTLAQMGYRRFDQVPNEEHKNYYDLLEKTQEEAKPTWEERIQPVLDREAELLDEHPMKGKPDPECLDCHGSGTKMTTYNPNSKWDWYSVGGRWSGYLRPDYDPTKDQLNQERCGICNGTGMRMDNLGVEERKRNPSYTCNGCDGKGRRTAWPTQWVNPPLGGNCREVEIILELNEQGHNLRPFAFLTPAGEWIERGKMGWWAIVSDEKEADTWVEECNAIFKKYEHCWAVVVDCHI